MTRLTKPLFLLMGMLALYFIYFAWQIRHSTYIMMDSSWTLWHQWEPNRVYTYWYIQGRPLGGLLMEGLFAWAGKISNLSNLRIISLIGWISCTWLLFTVLKYTARKSEAAWDSGSGVSHWARWLTVVYAASSLPVVLYIGWTSCMETFIPTLLSLSAGLILFRQSRVRTTAKKYGMTVLSILLGIIALCFYQSCYPFFLLPFYVLFVQRKDGKFTRRMRIAIGCFFITLVLYYLLFRWSTHLTGVQPSERTKISLNLIDRLSFFFSYPMNQAFNLSLFFDTKSVLSQLVFPVLFAGWLLFTFFYRQESLLIKGRYILGVLFWWILGYLPQLAAGESEGPYRTMPVLSVMVFFMLADLVLLLIREGQGKEILGFALTALLLWRGTYVYTNYISRPFSEEYRSVRLAVSRGYTSKVKKVVFVLADTDGFETRFGVRHFKDEFAMPSIHKDWTPEPLVRQIVYELTGDRGQAQELEVSVFSQVSEISDKTVFTDPGVLFIDGHSLF